MFYVTITTHDDHILYYKNIKLVEDDVETINIVDCQLKLLDKIPSHNVKDVVMFYINKKKG